MIEIEDRDVGQMLYLAFMLGFVAGGGLLLAVIALRPYL